GAIHVTLHDVPTQASVGPQRALKVDARASLHRAQGGGLSRDAHDVGDPLVARVLGDGETHAVHRDRLAVLEVVTPAWSGDRQLRAGAVLSDCGDSANGLD